VKEQDSTPTRADSAPKRAPAHAAPLDQANAIAAEEEIQRVRDILFGQQMRSHREELGRLDDLQTQRREDLRAEVRQQLASLESYVKHEINALSERLGLESRDRTSDGEKLTAKLHGVRDNLEARLSTIDSKAVQGQGDLREQLVAQSKLLTDMIQQRHDESLLRQKEGFAALEAAKTDRSTLARLLWQIAGELEGETEAPPEPQAE
jgi:hypothetical protein